MTRTRVLSVKMQVEKVMAIMQHATIPDGLGLLPTAWDIASGEPLNCRRIRFEVLSQLIINRFSAHYSAGARADSAHEYMLKQWLLSGKSEPRGRDMCKYQLSASRYNLSQIMISIRPYFCQWYNQQPAVPQPQPKTSLRNRYQQRNSIKFSSFRTPVLLPTWSFCSRCTYAAPFAKRTGASPVGGYGTGKILLDNIY